MPSAAKPRGVSRQGELDLTKLEEGLDNVPDEATLGRLQTALEVLISERSHPMIVELSKQLERLKNAEALIEREGEVRGKHRRELLHSEDDSPAAAESTKSSNIDAVPAPNSGSASPATSKGRDENAEDERSESRSARTESNDEGTGDSPSRAPSRAGSHSDTPSLKRKREDSVGSDAAMPDADGSADEAPDRDPKRRKQQGAGKGTPGSQMHVDPAEDEPEPKEEQRDPGNKKFVANPKSEFVPTQALPTHTLGLFDENDDDESEEAYKRKLGVVSYPKEDLSTLVAGPVPMDDYTRAKPANQVQWSTYATFLEPYFRPFVDEDIHFLQQTTVGGGIEAANIHGGHKLSPYTIPPLGPWYRQQWAQQDAEIAGTDVAQATKKAISAEPHTQASELARVYQPAGSLQDVSDQTLELPNKVSLGPFTERLLSALMPEAKEADGEDGSSGAEPYTENAASAIPVPMTLSPSIDDFALLEERVKGEFRYVGVLDVGLLRTFEQNKGQYKLALPQHRDEFSDPLATEMDWVNGSEDDEISRELRVLQRRLKEVSHRNNQYKRRLIPVVQEQLAWQEYTSILQDLDKQVDQAYAKRLKAPKAPVPKPKKKKSASVSATGSPASFSAADSPRSIDAKLPDHKPAVKALLDKRERWIQKIGPLFKEQYLMMRSHETPKFEGLADADEDDEDEDREE